MTIKFNRALQIVEVHVQSCTQNFVKLSAAVEKLSTVH